MDGDFGGRDKCFVGVMLGETRGPSGKNNREAKAKEGDGLLLSLGRRGRSLTKMQCGSCRWDGSLPFLPPLKLLGSCSPFSLGNDGFGFFFTPF